LVTGIHCSMPIAPLPTLRQLFINIPLRWVLTVPFVLPTIGAVTLVGYLSYRSGYNAVEDLGHQLVEETNERVAQELKAYLQTPLLINRLNIDAVHQGQLDLQNIPELETALFNRLQQFELVSAVLFANPEGTFRLVDRLPELYLVLADSPTPDEILVYRLGDDGRQQQLVATLTGLDVRRDRPWYQRAVTTGRLGWNPIAQYGSLELLTLDASQPVYDRKTKQLLGVFAVHVRLDYLSEFLYSLDISRFGRILVTDQNGTLIATSTRERPYQFVSGRGYRQRFKQLKMDESQDDLTRSLGEYLRDRPNALKSLEQPQYLEFRYNKELHYVEIAPFRDQYGLDWRIVTVIPQSHFLGAIQEDVQTKVLLSLMSLGGAIALGLIAADKLIARFAELNRVSRDLAAGNLTQRLPTDQPIAELNSLAQTFNQMADQLRQSFDSLETALATSEEKFSIIFHANPDPITLVAMPEGRCVEANESFLNLLEYSRDELIGQRFVDLGVWCNIEDRTRLRTALQDTGHIHNLEVQLNTRTGQVKTVLLSADLIKIDGEIYSLGIVRDISDRKQAEAALQESENRFRQLAETVREGFFVFEVESSHYSYINPAYAAINGSLPQSLYVGMFHWLDSIHPDDRDRIEAALERERQGHAFHQEYRTFGPDGQMRWLRSQAFPIADETGIIVRVVGTVEDISDRKQAEAALRESEERFRRAFDDAPIGIALISITGCFLKVNRSLCEIVGYTVAELLTQNFQDLTHAEDAHMDLNAMQQLLSDEIQVFQTEKRYLKKQGHVVPCAQSVSLVKDQDNRPLYFIAQVQDITDRLKVERMKGEFISIVSHELRTPLTSIQGALGILGTGIFNKRPERANQMLQIAISNSNRLVRLVNDILDLERLESGKVQLVMEYCQVANLMQQAVDSVQAIADQSDVTLSYTFLDTTLWAAPDAIIQSLTNLLSNAIKFSTAGDIVWFKAAIQHEAQKTGKQVVSRFSSLITYPSPSYILFTVQDQGRGIPADKLDIIFEQFQQVDVSDSRKKGGTGLGLAICKNIVQQHSGRIWVESRLGQGSTFYIALPISSSLQDR